MAIEANAKFAQRALSDISKRRVFALTSWGAAGMLWIAKCLNLHRDLRAFMHMRDSLGQLAGSSVTATQYLQLIGTLSSHYEVCGSVFGISPHEFSELEGNLPLFKGAHLIGPPILRYAGSLAYSRNVGRHWNHQHFLDLWGLKRGERLSEMLLEILGEDGDHVPAHYMVHVINNVTVPHAAPFFRLERLMTEDEEWETFVGYISGGTITDFGHSWHQLRGKLISIAQEHEPFRAIAREAVDRSSRRGFNRRRSRGDAAGFNASFEVWNLMPSTTQEVISAMLTPEARQAYANLGYDLSFVPTRFRKD
jgi:hypothetical protein